MSVASSQPKPKMAFTPNATITRWETIHEELAIIRIEPDKGQIAAFKPGQFAIIGLPADDTPGAKLIQRAYSIASGSNTLDHLELYIVLVKEGALTPKVWKLGQGGRLWLSPKISGHFTLDPAPPGKDLVMISTGTGLAPFVSMWRTYRDQNRYRRCILINGVREARDLGYRNMLEAAHQNNELVYIPVVSREPSFTGMKGRVPVVFEGDNYERLVGAPLDPQQCHVFLCGNPDMINQMETWLQGRGFTTHSKQAPGNIHLERYW